MSVCVSIQIATSDDISIVKDGTTHKLVVKNCKEDDAGKYRFEADGRKTEAMLIVEGNGVRLFIRTGAEHQYHANAE